MRSIGPAILLCGVTADSWMIRLHPELPYSAQLVEIVVGTLAFAGLSLMFLVAFQKDVQQ